MRGLLRTRDPVRGSREGWGRGARALAAAAALAIGLPGAHAQQETPAGQPNPPSVETQPLAPLPGAAAAPPSVQAPSAQAPSPTSPPAAAAAGDVATLAPPPADASMPDEVEVIARPAVALRASSSWDDGYDTLTKTFKRLADEMAKAGIKVTGKPISTFLETDDNGFRFEAQLPIEAAPQTRPSGLPAEITFGQTPSGKFIRFVHRSPYDDIDSTYEAVSAYLDSKGVEVKDTFTEEYVNQGANAGDPALELFIYVQPKG